MIKGDAGSANTLLEALDSFTQAALSGALPPGSAPFLAGAKLIPLKKPGAKMAVRPIAVGECLRRLVGKIAMDSEVIRECAKALLPMQCGVSCPGACETTAMGLQQWVESHKSEYGWSLLLVDMKNAFNSLDRAAVFDGFARLCLELMP